jgi:S-DNA-T family DNA segregation ATPase FtsK/SpoIIIE
VEQIDPIGTGVYADAHREPTENRDPKMETPLDLFSVTPEEAIPEAEIIHEEIVSPSVIEAQDGDSVPISEDDLAGAIDEYLLEANITVERPSPKPRSPLPAQEGAPSPCTPCPAHEITVTERADVEVPASWDAYQPEDAADYALPPVDLLDEVSHAHRNVDNAALTVNAGILERKLSDLGVQANVVAVHPGPVITMYELSLAPGVPLRRVMNMADDLAMALKSGSTRVVAPIPGKDTVGIEVPNLNREVVQFREIIESQTFRDAPGPLKMALGKKIDGQPFATSLLRMPHLLIAGATGTGKSVGLNSLICSWLMSCSPDDVKFLLVDPKKLELSYYQDIPHLLHPVVTDADKVPAVLGWAIREMERRYDLLSLVGARNISGYNELLARGKVPPSPDGSPPEKLPYIVIIVDELAELMMVAAKDIEISIARLAQMARASGIHLILATQRPSVDVITGVIKANFPARLSYQVSAKADSRTILDTVGAEHLLGLGDMLFMPPGTAKLIRLHGAYISEDEIRRIVDFVKRQRPPQYLQEISRTMAGDGKPNGVDLGYDEKYDEAVDLVTRLGHASISLIQRHMRIGYNRAARIMETMESEGLVGPSDGTSRPREVLARSLHQVSDQLN